MIKNEKQDISRRIMHYKNGQVWSEGFSLNGVIHGKNTVYNKDGTICFIQWFDQQHLNTEEQFREKHPKFYTRYCK